MRFASLALALVLFVAVTLCACADDSTSSPDNSPAPDIGYAPDATPDAGSEVATDAASGADSGGDGVPLSAADYCEATVDVFCPYYMRCGRIVADDMADCRATFLETCNAAYEPQYRAHEEAGLLRLSAAGIETCRAHLEAVACEEQLFDLDGPCAAVWEGQAQAGEACAPGIGSFVCDADSACRLGLNEGYCGVCEPAADIGEACGEEARCHTGARCIEGVCVARALPGEACDEETKPCVTGASCSAGVCRGFEIVAVGEACNQVQRCPYKATCREGVCVESALLGESCVDRGCASGWCDGAVCQPFSAPGEACTSAPACGGVLCSDGTCDSLLSACLR